MFPALLLALSLGTSPAEPVPGHDLVRPRQFRNDGAERVSRLGQTSYAFFDAFPSDGAGTSGACSTTAPTGARGEVLTFTRASSATCTKTATGGLATTGIADGDLVSLSTNVARVEYDSAGTLGLLVESARTNVALRSQELDPAGAGAGAWTVISGGGPALPTVTADACTAPDGTLTAERVQIPAVSGAAKYTLLRQSRAIASNSRYTLYARSYTGAGAQTFWISEGSLIGNAATNCATLEGSWMRCEVAAQAAGAGQIDIGTNTGITAIGTGSHPAADLCVWGVDVEAGAYATSYIPTTSAAVTRAAETASFPGAAWPVSPVSFASSVTTAWSGTATAADMFVGNVGSNSGWGFGWSGGTLRSQPCTAGVCATLDVAQGPTALAASRWAVSYSGTTTSIYKDAALIAGPTVKTAPNSPWATNTTFGSGVGWGWLNGIITRVCLDPDPTRCR